MISNLICLLLLLYNLKLCNSVEWKCAEGCNIPTLESNRIYCQSLGNKNNNVIMSTSYYDMMPTATEYKFFTGVFSYYDSTSTHYHSYGLGVTGVNANSGIYSSDWNTIYKNTMIKVYIKISYVSPTEVKVETTYSLFDTGVVIGTDTSSITSSSERFGYIGTAKFSADIGDTYSDTGRIYIYDAYTQHNGKQLYFAPIASLSPNDSMFQPLYGGGAIIQNNMMYLSSVNMLYNTDFYLNVANRAGKILRYDVQCIEYNNVYWGFGIAPGYGSYHNGFNGNCWIPNEVLISIPNNLPRMRISTYPGIENGRIECTLKNFQLLDTVSNTPTITPTNAPSVISSNKSVELTPTFTPTFIQTNTQTNTPTIINVGLSADAKNKMFFGIMNEHKFKLTFIILLIFSIVSICIFSIYVLIQCHTCYLESNGIISSTHNNINGSTNSYTIVSPQPSAPLQSTLPQYTVMATQPRKNNNNNV